MKQKLEAALHKKYPKILRGVYCSHNDGWYWIVDLLCRQLQWDTDKNGYPQVRASQIKEKFGTLRFYANGTNDRQQGMIDIIEQLSALVCEECGSIDGVKQTRGWIVTLCKKCMKERHEKDAS